jgi:hypothetical protein
VDVRVGAARQQFSNHGLVMHTEVQGRSQPGVAGQQSALVDDRWLFVEDGSNRGSIATTGRRKQRTQAGLR